MSFPVYPGEYNLARRSRLGREADARAIRIINDKVGQFRFFRGTISVDLEAGPSLTDEDCLADIQHLCDARQAAVYWADGSRCMQEDTHNQVLGAGVAWQIRDEDLEEGEIGEEVTYASEKYPLGEETGDVKDTELFGIAAALGLAVERRLQDHSIVLVRIFSDSKAVLTGLRSGRIVTLGPACSSPWALQDVYDRTDILRDLGVAVQLVWVKGHARSKGNDCAHAAARGVVNSQMQSGVRGRGWVKMQGVPEQIAEMGIDSITEWYWRMNKEWILQGRNEDEEEGEEGEEDEELEDGEVVEDATSAS